VTGMNNDPLLNRIPRRILRDWSLATIAVLLASIPGGCTNKGCPVNDHELNHFVVGKNELPLGS
jgi:hypothetical protein